MANEQPSTSEITDKKLKRNAPKQDETNETFSHNLVEQENNTNVEDLHSERKRARINFNFWQKNEPAQNTAQSMVTINKLHI